MKEFGRRAIMRGAAALGIGAAATKVSEGVGSGPSNPYPSTGMYASQVGNRALDIPTPAGVKELRKRQRSMTFDERLEMMHAETMRSWSPMAREMYVRTRAKAHYQQYQELEDQISKLWDMAKDPVGSLLRGSSDQPAPTHPPPSPR